MSQNISEVRLLRSGPKSDYKHTYYFIDEIAQRNYFINQAGSKEFTNFSYQRKDSKLRVNLSFDEAQKYTYVMYRNSYYNKKWFYAFITEYEWKSEDVTELTLETDVMQTWYFEKGVGRSFVEREHTNNDEIGANTIPENLESGEYIINWEDDIAPFKSLNIVVGVTATNDGKRLKGSMYTGCYSGIFYFAFPFTTEGMLKLNEFISSYDTSSEIDNNAIVSMFLAPAELSKTEGSANEYAVLASQTPYNALFTFDKNVAFQGYTPKNNKLFTYPYNYLLVSNNNGASAIYQFEHFSKEQMAFIVYGVLTPGCSIRMLPMNYKGSTTNHEEGLNLGKYPICNWTSDEYTNWLTQNSVNIGLSLASGLGQIVAGGITAGFGGAGGIVSGISGITNQLAQIHQMSFTPPQANGNVNSGDVITAVNKNTFTLYNMCCKPEYMKIIDEFFSMYGYKTNRVKVPNSNHRENWWYTKTIDANIYGEIPSKDLEKIKECYNNGITFWKDPTKVGQYNLSNKIV